MKGKPLEMKVANRLFGGASDFQQARQGGCDRVGASHILATAGPVGEHPGLPIQIPLAWFIQHDKGVFQVTTVSRLGHDDRGGGDMRWDEPDNAGFLVHAGEALSDYIPHRQSRNFDVAEILPFGQEAQRSDRKSVV